jgi:cytosine/creatinine deaminase
MVAHMPAVVLTGAKLLDGVVMNVLITDGTIAAVGLHVDAPEGAEIVDLDGYVLLPSAVEPHAHLDKAFLAELVVNETGDLYGAIEAMKASRHLTHVDDTIERAERAARLMAANGFSAIRSHADTTRENGLDSIEALAEVRRRVADVIDIEIVALSSWPVTGAAGADQRSLLADAIDAGADLVGGCPHLEAYTGAGDIESATDVFLQIATDHGRGVDLHTDETLDPNANGLDVLADRVLQGFDLGATASHCVSLGQQPLDVQQATAERVAEAGINVVVLPHTNLFLQGRGQSPMPRGLTAISTLRAAGVNVAAGADNLQDPFNPVGRACPFETAGLMVMAAHDLPVQAWRSVSSDAAEVMGRKAEIAVGAEANLIAVRGATVREAIAFGPSDRIVWRKGQRISVTRTTSLV